MRIRLAKAFLNDAEARHNRAVNELLTQDKIVIFTGAKKVSDIRSDIRDHKFAILIIDYLQLLICTDRYKGNRVSEVGELSRELKDLAMSFNIPILALSQLNRASEGRQNKEPLMSEIRESGSIEQDASIIFIMWDKDTDDRSQKGFKTEKSRNGVCARYDLVFDGPSMKFKGENQVSPFEGR